MTYKKKNQHQKKTQQKGKRKREERSAARLAKVAERLSSSIEKTEDGKSFLVGRLDGKIVYTSRPLKTVTTIPTLKSRWMRRIAKKLTS